MFSPLPTTLFLLLFMLIEPTAAQDQPSRWDVLKGMGGELSCDLQHKLSMLCQLKNDTTPDTTPSKCTCNKVYFNIWSACSYSRGNNTLPVYSSWMAICQAGSESVNGSAQWVLSPPGVGPPIPFPEWAKLDVPNNGIFDMMQAVSVAIGHPPTPVSVIVTSAVGGFISALLLTLLYYGWRQRGHVTRKTAFQKFRYPIRSRRLRNVEQEDPKSDWTIDRAEEPQQPEEEFVFVQPASPVSPTSPTPPVSPREEPLRSRWSDSVHTPSSVTGSQRSLEGSWGESIAKRVRAVPGLLPIPWKARPIRVTTVPARRGFRVDTHDRTFGFVSPSSIKPNRFHETIHEDDEEQNNGTEGHRPQQSIHEADDERMTLISDHDRTNNDVFLVSRNGADFNSDLESSRVDSSINSNIVVVTPGEDMHSPQRPTPNQRSKKSARPSLPPPPSHPPPAIPRTNYQPRVEDQTPASRLPPPINTLQPNGVEPSHSPSALLPVALERSESNIRRHQPSIDHSHYRSPSIHDSIDVDFEAAAITRKSSKHSYRGPLQHQRSISHSALPVVDEVYHDPFAPSGHRRGLSADDTASFYLTAESPAYPPSPGHQLSAESLIPRRTDPVMLFPGSVRGVGYGASDVYPQLPPGALQPNRR